MASVNFLCQHCKEGKDEFPRTSHEIAQGVWLSQLVQIELARMNGISPQFQPPPNLKKYMMRRMGTNFRNGFKAVLTRMIANIVNNQMACILGHQ